MIVYKITFPNDKVYIGCTIKALSERQKCHKSYAKNNPRTIVHRAIKKYGWNSLKWEILEQCTSVEEIHFLEKYYIKFYNSLINFNGYNATKGGEGTVGSLHNLGRKHSKKTCEKARKKQTELRGKKVILIDADKKTTQEFNSIGDVARFTGLRYEIFKVARTKNYWYKQYKLIDVDKFNPNDKNLFIQQSHRGYHFSITNGIETKQLKSINDLRRFLNISERTARHMYYNKKIVQNWKKI